MEQLDKLKIRLNMALSYRNQDANLRCILEDVEAYMLAFTNRNELLPSMKSLQIKIAIIEYNKQGSEGMSSQSQGGVSQSWIDGLPQDIILELKSFRRLKVSNYATEKY